MIKKENKVLKITISKETMEIFNRMKENEGFKSESKYGKYIIEKYMNEYEKQHGKINVEE